MTTITAAGGGTTRTQFAHDPVGTLRRTIDPCAPGGGWSPTIHLIAPPSSAIAEPSATAEPSAAVSFPRLTGVAYAGAPVQLFVDSDRLETVIFDFSGMQLIPFGGQIPLLFNHYGGPVGFISDAYITTDGLTIDATLLTSDEAGEQGKRAKEIVAFSRMGYHWQLSVGFKYDSEALERVSAGSSAEVNGRTVNGPIVIARKTRVLEVSIVELGADPDTSTAILKQQSAQAGRHAPHGERTMFGRLAKTSPDVTPADEATDATPPAGNGSTEMISISDISADWLREHMPKIVTELVGETAEEAGAAAAEAVKEVVADAAGVEVPSESNDAPSEAPVSGTVELAASIAQLRAIDGIDADAIVAALSGQMTIKQATEMVALLTSRAAQSIAGAQQSDRTAELAAQSAGSPPVPASANLSGKPRLKLSGTDPAADWRDNKAALAQAGFTERSWLGHANACRRIGLDYTKDAV